MTRVSFVVADSEGRQEPQTIYSTMQFVPSSEFGSEMLYAASTPGATHHGAHHLQYDFRINLLYLTVSQKMTPR